MTKLESEYHVEVSVHVVDPVRAMESLPNPQLEGPLLQWSQPFHLGREISSLDDCITEPLLQVQVNDYVSLSQASHHRQNQRYDRLQMEGHTKPSDHEFQSNQTHAESGLYLREEMSSHD